MSKQVFGKIAIGAAIVGAAFLTGGASLVPSMTLAGTGATVGGFLATTALGSTMLAIGGAQILSGVASSFAKKPELPSAQVSRLNLSTNASEPLKTALGQTALATDVRYQEWNGPDQDITDIIVAHATHRIGGVDTIYLDNELAWTSGTGAVGNYVGYFFANTYVEGGAGVGPTLESGKWTSANSRLTGCGYSHLRFKLSGNGKKAESPFSSGVPTRITFLGRGSPVYDPRRDSTVPGGFGPMRADDQSTWAYEVDGDEIGANLALQILRYYLGWRINGKLAVGCGLPKKRLDMPSFLAAANLCSELVTIAAGGSEPRYHGGCVVSEADDPRTVVDMLCAGCNGRIREVGGKLGLIIAHNDLAEAAADDGLNDDDVMGAFSWNPDPSLEATPNIVRGRYTDPSPNSLFQMIPYADATLPSPDGIDRIFPLDLGAVQSPSHAQRVASQVLERKQYDRTFSAPFDIRAWHWPVGKLVPFTFAPLGFNRKLFRVVEQELAEGGLCVMTLREETAAIYAWDGGDGAPVTPAAPNVYDRRNNPLILGIDEAGTTAVWNGVTGIGRPEDFATDGAPAGSLVAGVPAEQLVLQVVDMADVLAPSGAVFSAIAEIDASLDETSAELAASTASIADLQTRSGVIEQRINVRPNLVPGIEAGTAGWTGDLSGFFFAATSTWGAIAISSSITGSGGVASPLFVVQPNEWYTVSGDPIIIAETGLCYFDIVFLRANGSIAGDGPEHLIFTPRDFSTDGSGQSATAIEAQAPADAVHGVARFIWGGVTGITWLGFRLLKAERGRLPFTSYTSDATVVALDAAVRTETLVRTNAITALSQRTDLVEARVTDAENAALASGAAFQQFVQTIAGANAAQAIFNTGISAQVSTAQGTADNALQAANEASAGVASEQIARANAVAAQAERVDTVVAQLSGATGSGLKAQIDANATAAADANTAVASSLQVVRARPFSTGNLLTNTDYAVDGVGWQTYASIGTVSFARDLAGDSWRPLPEHTLGVYQSDATSGAIGVYYQDVPAVAGEWYIAAAYAAAHRTTISLGVEFRDAAGTQIGVANPGYFPVGTGGTDLNLYSRLWAKGQAPAGTTSARFVFIKGQTTPGQADSFAWMVRPSLSVATAEQDQPPAYSPGSARAALAAQGAVVSQHAATLATHDSKLQAFLEQTVSVPGATAAVILKAATSGGGSTSSVALLAQKQYFYLEGSDPSQALLGMELALVGGVPTLKLYGNLETAGSVSFGNLRLDTLRSFVSDGDPAQYYNTLPGSFLPIAGLSLTLPNVKPTGAIEMRLTGSIWATGTDGAAPYFDSALIITLVGSIAGTHSVSVAPPENFSTRFLNDTLVVDVMLDGAAFEGDVAITAALYRGNTVIPSGDPLQPEYRSVSIGAENIAIKAKWRFA